MNTPKEIVIKIIPHNEHRYDTFGDYWIDENGNWQVRISNMNSFDSEFLVAMHELTEFYLTQKREITEQSITEFDVMFEQERKRGIHSFDEEPGDDIRAPYYKEHRFSENIERQIAHEANIDWDEHGKRVVEL